MSDDEAVSDHDHVRVDEETSSSAAEEAPPVDLAAPATDGHQSAHDVTFVLMSAESVTFDLADASPHLHLMEADVPYRNISIPIALADAHALHNALNGVEGRRPGTHELASAIIRQLQADIIAARIVRVDQGVFYAEIDLMTPRGRERFDCRTSDAVILALRQGVPAPILCAQEVLDSLYS
ncbi:MAG TPA: bifunctional nuclease family protein [Acidimicrobiales bacterium]